MNKQSRHSFDVSLIENLTNDYQKQSCRYILEKKFQDIANHIHNANTKNKSSFALIDRACPICFCDKKHRKIIDKYNVSIVECASCKFWFATPVFLETLDPNSHLWAGTFDDVHIKFLQSETYKKISALRYTYELDIIDSFTTSPNGSLLDIGCGTGEFLRLASNRGWQTYGVEVQATSAQIAQNDLKNIVNAHFSANLFATDLKFDTIVTLDTLEHIFDLDIFLKDIRNIIRKDGLLLIQVPNASSLAARLKMEKDNMFNGLIHFNYFEKASLKTLIEKYKFKMIHHETVITELNSILNFDYEIIIKTANEILQNRKMHDLTPDFILDNNMGYKSISIFKAI